jgi:hypothetical protein
MIEYIYKINEISNGWVITIWEEKKIEKFYDTQIEAIIALTGHFASLAEKATK